ncbi:hypothetical protein LTR84_001870 [Exophiala bonariae]|uniref:Cleavage/polyadenylation specificity factor A subunit C-terminal domain-containing protein n=1 Tax=Exophiala bonariae TaxID=1690606 RepID=A0AAV9NBU3_9EURO|nr:hypothetical protein LTR84_001870 [Exophiala bonariae]
MSKPNPCFVIYGPDKQGALYTLDQSGRRTVLFSHKENKSKPQLELYVVQGGLLQPLSTASFSSLSSSITMNIHGQEIKMKDKYSGLTPYKAFTGPVGELTWKPTKWANGSELWDSAGVLLARYKHLKFSGDPVLEIFVQLDNILMELVVTAAVSILVDEKKGLKIAGELVEALSGV